MTDAKGATQLPKAEDAIGLVFGVHGSSRRAMAEKYYERRDRIRNYFQEPLALGELRP